jgi:hypothetical protein
MEAESSTMPGAQMMAAPAPLENKREIMDPLAPFERNKYQTVTIHMSCPVVVEIDSNIYTKSCKKFEHKAKKAKKSVATHLLAVIPQTCDGQVLQPCEKCEKFLEVADLKQKDKVKLEKHCAKCKSEDHCHYHFALRILCGHGNLAKDLWLKCELRGKSVNTVIHFEATKVAFCATRGTKQKPMEKQLKFISFSVLRFLNRFLWVLF